MKTLTLISCMILVLLLDDSLPGPKTLFLDRYYFHPRVSVCLCLSVYLDYLKKFLTDLNETWQDDV